MLINLKQELLNYPPIDLKSFSEKESGIPDNIMNSIILYNKALDSIQANSEDIAVIELKRAISMNGNFHEAMNLLGVCYLYVKDFAKAAEIFQKVALLEKNGVRAMSYLEMVNKADSSEQLPETKKKTAYNVRIDNYPKDFFKRIIVNIDFYKIIKSLKTDVIKYVIGFAAGFLLVFLIGLIFIVPAVTAGKDRKDPEIKPAPAVTDNKAEILYEQKLKKLTEDYEKLQSEAKRSQVELDYYRSLSKLADAEKLNNARDYEAAGDILIELKTVEFKDEYKSKYDSLYANVIPKAAWSVFNQGITLAGQKKYQEAIGKLGKVQGYGADWAYMDITMYNIGNCYKELGDKQNALKVFETLISKYPNSQYARYAQNKIVELNAVQ